MSIRFCILGALLAACSGKPEAVRCLGPDTATPIAALWARHRGETAIDQQGTATSVRLLLRGEAELAVLPRKLSPRELERTRRSGTALMQHLVGYACIAVYAAKDSPIVRIDTKALRRLCAAETGEVALRELAAGADPDARAGVVFDPAGGLTAAILTQAFDAPPKAMRTGLADATSPPAALAYCREHPRTIAVAPFTSTPPDGVRLVPLVDDQGKEHRLSTENIGANDYPLERSFYACATAPNEATLEACTRWLRGEEGRRQLQQLGYVPASP